MKTGLLFAGQGAQCVGMGRDLAEAFPECREAFTRANEVLGYDLAKLCFEGPESELVKSHHCQPAIFVVSMVCWRALILQYPALAVEAVAGLSLGEWSALCLADAVSFEDGLRVLSARGRFMQEACEEREGAMLSVIGLNMEALQHIAANAGVEIANFNSPEQTVLSGPKADIQQAEKLAATAGAKRVVMLNVAGAYHSSLMASAAKRLEQFLQSVQVRAPRIPVMANVTGRPHGTPEDIKREMVRQVTASVQWVSSIQSMQQRGIQQYIECGPGRVLSGLVKRIHAGAILWNVQDRPSLDKTLAALAPKAG
ncbi:MAG: ACP S-malonyltransferase [Verrucomicrobia bacterium]|nr:ACP S-malonyltransferase [Verrucomicrobiota bacterium]MBU4290750.1 ACP S-malonyltransferase [Verrucomicrobiota bacterium]MBU4428683.1 ACP S-malonyltransferase [Verrucomicrobiota bacterium]MCG2679768.1 ACP S-malonyltransferase [Kiritimatiellia bacterium]